MGLPIKRRYQSHWISVPSCVTFFCWALLSCGDDSGVQTADASLEDVSNTQATLRAETLANLGTGVVRPTYQAFAAEAATLETVLNSYASNTSISNREAAQASWRDAMVAWQRAEIMQFGPLAAMTLAEGGEDLRDGIYAWPLANPCAADQLTVSDDYSSSSALATRPINTRGLGIIEYLLYAPPEDNSCSALANINQEGTWASFGSGAIVERRAVQAAALAAIVRSNADALVARWGDEGFLRELTSPSRSGALYGSAQEGLNAVSDAMFYIDKETKDMKLAGPIGVTCDAGDTCPDLLESQFANISKELLIANLEGFQLLFHGGPVDGTELGFKELLESMGASTFAQEMSDQIALAIAAVQTIPGSLSTSLESSEASDAHAAIIRLTDSLKGMFVGVLDFEIPGRAAGDND